MVRGIPVPDFEDPKPKDGVAAGAVIPGETKDPAGQDIEAEPVDLKTVGALDQTEQPIPDPFFWPEDRSATGAERDPATPAHTAQRDEIVEIMARAMRLRSVEANRIITKPADIQRYVETCWIEELPAAQAAHAALEAAGHAIVRDRRQQEGVLAQDI